MEICVFWKPTTLYQEVALGDKLQSSLDAEHLVSPGAQLKVHSLRIKQ